MRIGLVACTKSKLPQGCSAKEMYSASALFRKAATFCEQEYECWYILSAKYGLVAPDEIIEPYDQTLRTMSKAERESWGKRVSGQLLALGEHEFFAHAGRDYLRPLSGVKVTDVLAGLRIGERLGWYKTRLPGELESVSGGDRHSNSSRPVGDRASCTTEYEVRAHAEDYRRISTHIGDMAKLQYQLVGVAYALAGTALALWGNAESLPDPLLILFFPPIFCAIVLVQLYLHSNIKALARYNNFRLRPRMEAIIRAGRPDRGQAPTVWGWEEYYVRSHWVPRLVVRQLGSAIIVLALLPAAGALFLFWLFAPRPFTDTETLWLVVDIVAIVSALVLIVVVKLINEEWWRIEAREREGELGA